MHLHGYSARQGRGPGWATSACSWPAAQGGPQPGQGLPSWPMSSKEAKLDEGSASTEVRGPGSMWREAVRAEGPEPGGSRDGNVA